MLDGEDEAPARRESGVVVVVGETCRLHTISSERRRVSRRYVPAEACAIWAAAASPVS